MKRLSFLPHFHELASLPPVSKIDSADPTLEASFLIPARGVGEDFKSQVAAFLIFLEKKFSPSVEVILVPNPPQRPTADKSVEICAAIARENPRTVRSVPHLHPLGKGAALRTGVLAARGRKLFFTDADFPYDWSFFVRANEELDRGVAFVSGNRRLPESVFETPVSVLPLIYKRHRLGLLFNRLSRALLPVQTTDTQAGIKAFSRELALDIFHQVKCPGFFFDLEVFLIASRRNSVRAELPVVLFMRSEKSTVRIFREGLLAAFWLTRIALASVRKEYR